MTIPIHPEEHDLQASVKKQESRFEGHIISVNFDKMSAGEKSLEKSFFRHVSQHFSRQDDPTFSEDAKYAQYVLNDFLTAGRNVAGLIGANPNTQNLLGEAGGTLIGTGLTVLAEGDKAEKLAKRALDPQSEKEASLTKKIGITEAAMGATMVGSRSLNLDSTAKGVNAGMSATTPLGQATFGLGSIAGILSSVWYAFVGFSSWSSLKEVWRIEDGIKDKTPADAITFLSKEISFTVDETIQALKEKYEQEHPDKQFAEWCKEILDQEAVSLAKDFLQAINPNPDKTYDFEKHAETIMQSKALEGITINPNPKKVEASNEIEKLGLSPSQLLGLESLHRNRLEIAKAKLSRSIGKEAFEKLLEIKKQEAPTEADQEALLEAVNKGLCQSKIDHIIVLSFVAFGLAVAVASAVGSCIACPPLGLIVACAVLTIVSSIIISYVDLELLCKTWDKPVGKLEEATNTTKLLMGIGCIAGICLLSGATAGTLPVAVSLVVVSSVVVTSLFRYVHTYQKRVEEKEIAGSMDSLIEKLKKATGESTLERQNIEKKIQKIIAKKLARTHESILAKIPDAKNWANRILQPIGDYELTVLQEDIKKWQEAEEAIIKELKEAFQELGEVSETGKSWIESIKQSFVGVPHLRRVFPESSAAS